MTQKFKEFKVSELFEVTSGGRVTKDQQRKGNIPYVTAVSTNQGIDSYISNPKFTKENIITVSFLGDVFYHPYELGYKDGTCGLELKNDYKKTDSVYLYLTVLIRKIAQQTGSYTGGLIKNIIENIELSLPITEDNQPDYDYMENYIKEIEQKYIDNLEQELLEKVKNLLGLTNNTKASLTQDFIENLKENMRESHENKSFKEFKISELFEVTRGNISNQGNLKEVGKGVNFVAQNMYNNGFVKSVELDDQIRLFNGKCIIVGRQTGVVYYQNEPFVTTDGVLVLNLKDDEKMTYRVGTFLTTLIKKHLQSTEYTNTLSQAKLDEIELSLPITEDEEPDYDYMENYIKSIELIYIYILQNYVKKKKSNS